MQVVPPPQIRMIQWMPVNPSWVVAAGLAVAAALPHNLPIWLRKSLLSMPGTIVLFSVATWLIATSSSPVLAVALLLLWGSVSLLPLNEGFQATVLNKNRIGTDANKVHRWFSEETLNEEPEGIQERTEESQLTLNRVEPDESAEWTSEHVLQGSAPAAIQERPSMRPPEYDESSNSVRH